MTHTPICHLPLVGRMGGAKKYERIYKAKH